MSFDDRQKAFENKFQHDEAIRFKVEARRAKLVGLWAAGHLGLTGDDAAEYAKAVVKADMAQQGTADIVAKLTTDFAAKQVNVSEHMIQREIETALETAKQQVMAE